jgi:hypothetical protein
MAGPIISKLLTDFFNEIGHKRNWTKFHQDRNADQSTVPAMK